MSASLPVITSDHVLRREESGPLRQEERFCAFQQAVEAARSEYRLYRLDAVARLITPIIPTLRGVEEDRYRLLLASALALLARVHLRRMIKASEHGDADSERLEDGKQRDAFKDALKLFRDCEKEIGEQPSASRLYTDYGIVLFRTGDYEESIRVLELVRQSGATPAEAFGYLGLAYRELGDYEKASEALKKGLQLSPGDPILLEALGKTLETAGQRAEALRTYCQAAAATEDKDLASAQQLLRAALEIQPDDAQALSMLTLLLRSEGNYGVAVELLDQTLARFPEHQWALALRAMLLRDQNDSDGAIREFRKVKVTSADLAWVWLEEAEALAASDPKSARQLVRRAAKLLGEEHPRVVQSKDQVEIEAALASTIGEVRAEPSSLWNWVSEIAKSSVFQGAVGGLLFNLLQKFVTNFDDSKQPIEFLQQMLELLPNSVQLREALARLYLTQRNYSEAQAVLDEALQIAPDSSRLFGLKAEVLDAIGNLEEAVRFYRRASRATPDDRNAFDALLRALIRADQVEEVLGELDRKIKTSEEDGDLLAKKGEVLFNAGRIIEAQEPLQRAEQILEAHRESSKLLSVRICLGEVLRKLDRYEDARNALTRAIMSDNWRCDARGYTSLLLIDVAEYAKAAQLSEEAIGLLLPQAVGIHEFNPQRLEILLDATTELSADERNERTTRLGWFYNTLGWALQCGQDTPTSTLQNIFRTAFVLTPKDPYIQQNLGSLLLRAESSRKEGEEMLSKLVSDRSSNIIAPNVTGWCCFLLGEYDAAEYWLRSAVDSDAEDGTYKFDLALTILAAKRVADASIGYANAIDCARTKHLLRQRSLFHVALLALAQALREKRVCIEDAAETWVMLWDYLKASGFSNMSAVPQSASAAANI